MAEIKIPLGKEARLYYGTPVDGVTCTASAATLEAAEVEICGIRDATITLEKDDTDVARRCTHGWEDTRASVKRLSLSFDIFNTDDGGAEKAAINVLRKTFMNDTYNGAQTISGICFYALSSKSAVVTSEPGPQSPDGEGVCADFLITKFERGEPHADGQTYSVEAKMAQLHSGRTPAWV